MSAVSVRVNRGVDIGGGCVAQGRKEMWVGRGERVEEGEGDTIRYHVLR